MVTQEALQEQVSRLEAEVTNLKRRVTALEDKAKGRAGEDVQKAARQGFGEGHGAKDD